MLEGVATGSASEACPFQDTAKQRHRGSCPWRCRTSTTMMLTRFRGSSAGSFASLTTHYNCNAKQ
eukprot:289025-Amphidinium_carterae.1